jgi:hypothetical protein
VDKVEILECTAFRAMEEEPYYFVDGLIFLMGERMLLVRAVRGFKAVQTFKVEI